MNKEIQAGPEMQKFFEKLLDLKAYVSNQLQLIERDDLASYMLSDFYNRLDQIIKEEE